MPTRIGCHAIRLGRLRPRGTHGGGLEKSGMLASNLKLHRPDVRANIDPGSPLRYWSNLLASKANHATTCLPTRRSQAQPCISPDTPTQRGATLRASTATQEPYRSPIDRAERGARLIVLGALPNRPPGQPKSDGKTTFATSATKSLAEMTTNLQASY